MAAMMLVMIIFMAVGAHHGFTGHGDANTPQAQPTYIQIDRTASDKAASAPPAASPASSEAAE